MSRLWEKTSQAIGPLNQKAMEQAKEKLDNLLKPQGSLGKLEELAVQLSGISGSFPPPLSSKAIVMMTADNGVYAEGFHSYPQEITRIIAEVAGPGLAGVSVLARQAGAKVVVVDVGIKDEVQGQHIIRKKVRYGTANIAKGPAMTREEALQALEAGIEVTQSLCRDGIGVIGLGEAGICNTTTSAAVLAALLAVPPEEVVGQGAGADAAAYQAKISAVRTALAVNQPDSQDPLDILAKVGGLDIAGLVGCCLAGAAARVPVVIDGFIAGTAALLACRLNPRVRDYLIPSHFSAEKGTQILFAALEKEPMLLMNMRLGEGSGAALAFNLLDASCRIVTEMGTFADLEK